MSEYTTIPRVNIFDLLDAPKEEQDKYMGYLVSCYETIPTTEGKLVGFGQETIHVQVSKNKVIKYTRENRISFTLVQHQFKVMFQTPYGEELLEKQRELQEKRRKGEQDQPTEQKESPDANATVTEEPPQVKKKPKKQSSRKKTTDKPKQTEAKTEKKSGSSSMFVRKKKR